MKRGLDSNVLVYAHMPALGQHRRVRPFLLSQLEDDGVQLVVTAGVLHEFIHVVTDPRRFEPPVPVAEAIAVARGYLGRTNISVAPVNADAASLALKLLERHRLGRRRLADTLYAAALIVFGVEEIITCSGADFSVFDELAVVDPCVI